MNNFLKLAGVIFLLVLAYKLVRGPVNSPSKYPVPKPVENSSLSLTDMEGINYSISVMPDNIVDYLKEKSEYSKFLDRKLVIYPTGANCPYGRAFSNAVEKIRKNYDYKKEYNYYALKGNRMKFYGSPEEAEAEIAFMDMCHEFCVVNPHNNQIFSINGVGNKEADRLEYIFAQMENW